MIATAIITANRPRSTVHQSIASYQAAGFQGILMLFDDGIVESAPHQITHYQRNVNQLGNLRNWVLALETLFSETNAEWLMVCEDDITWASGSAAKLETELPFYSQSSSFKRTGAQSLYCPIRVSDDLERRRGAPLHKGWHLANHGMKTWGAQCLVFSRAQAATLLHSQKLREYLAQSRYHKNVDAIVADTLLNGGLEIAYLIPCLVNHDLGDANSSLGYRDDRPTLRTRYFAGVAT